jgi:hypothetical protein
MDCRVKPGNDVPGENRRFPSTYLRSQNMGAGLLRCEYASLILHPSSSF